MKEYVELMGELVMGMIKAVHRKTDLSGIVTAQIRICTGLLMSRSGLTQQGWGDAGGGGEGADGQGMRQVLAGLVNPRIVPSCSRGLQGVGGKRRYRHLCFLFISP